MVIGYIGLIENLLMKLQKESGFVSYKVVATGGYASLISKHIEKN